MEREIKVKGMHCEGCEQRVQKLVGRLSKIESVTADHQSGTVTIAYDGNPETLQAANEQIRELGYEVAQ